MLRVLTLSTLYPNGHQPQLGLFVERQTRGLATRDGIELRSSRRSACRSGRCPSTPIIAR
jgi:hypothetical protein